MFPNLTNKIIQENQPNFIGLAQVKEHLKITFDHEDDLIKVLINAAIQATESYTGLSIYKTNIEIGFNGFPRRVDLLNGPVLGGGFDVKYDNENGDELSLVDYYTHVQMPEMMPVFLKKGDADFPRAKDVNNSVRFSYVAGMEREQLPGQLQIAILLQIGDLYNYRGDRAAITNTRSMALMRPYKIWNHG